MMSTKPPLSLIKILLSFVISACSYDLWVSKVETSRPSCASKISVKNRASKDTVGDEILSPSFKYLFCSIQSAHVLFLIIPFLFSYIRLTASSDLFLSL